MNKPGKTVKADAAASTWHELVHDVPAAIAVALVSIPMCLGIAIISGAPPMAGLISGILGGIVVGAISRSQTCVSGPATGLSVVLLGALSTLGGRFDLFLISVVLCGGLQIILGLLQAGLVANYFPNSVVRGLLTAIGLVLIVKQIPHALGIDDLPESSFSLFYAGRESTFADLIQLARDILPGAAILSTCCLAAILIWERLPLRKLAIPSSLVAVVLGILINYLFTLWAPQFALSGAHLITLPKFDGLGQLGSLTIFPAWHEFWGEHTRDILLIALELAVVASLESLLTVEAIDKLDPRKRHTPPDRELVAQGIGNISAGLIGGLPMTSVVARSSLNVSSGSVSKKSTILNGFLVALALVLIPNVLNAIPLAALAPVLLVVGYRLASFSQMREIVRSGASQYLPYFATIIAILLSDILVGICIGLAVGVYFVLRSNSQTPFTFSEEKIAAGSVLRYKLSQQVTFLNRASIRYTLERLPDGAQVIFDASEADYIDDDILLLLRAFRQDEAAVRNIQMNLLGFRDSYSLTDNVDYINVLTQATQQDLSPLSVLQSLSEGNARFADGKQTQRDLLRQVALTSDKQYPMAAVLSCIDSRTTSELIFDLGLGDIFSVRVAGNVINDDVLGSLEYSTKVVGAKLIVVIGHTNCGAIRAACDDVQLGNITGLLQKIQVAIGRDHQTKQPRDSSNTAFVNNVTRLNVEVSIDQILEQSQTISEMVQAGTIAIVGAVYDTQTGRVGFFGDLVSQIHKPLATTAAKK